MRLLLFTVGAGAGNSTRTLGLLDELRRLAPDLDVQIAAQGRAAELLEGVVPLHRLRDVTYGSIKFSPWQIVTANLSLPVRFIQNRAAAHELLKKLRPNLVVADSDFYCLGPAARAGVPLASINSSPATVAAIRHLGVPRGCCFSAYILERTDAWLQDMYPDRVICPVLRRERGLPGKFLAIPPIVRPGMRTAPGGEVSDAVVVVTGGSGIGVEEIDLRDLEAPVVTCGSILAKVPVHTRQLGFTLDIIGLMRRARVLVIQGGFSSISEAVALRRPTVVIPIVGHAEQNINARIFQNLGLGLAATGPQAGAKVNEVLASYDEFTQRCGNHRITTDGAALAAQVLLEML